jgi:hypothetical protein
MNEMNELETQLRSWAPRRPSARISRALFGREALARFRRERDLKASHSSAFLLNWLAPAVAAVALMFALIHLPGNSTHSNAPKTAPMIAVILSNQSLGSVLFEASNREPANVHRGFDLRTAQPKAFGVATSGVSTGASDRLPDWPSQPQMEERDLPTTNGTGLAPQAAVPVRFDSTLRVTRAVPLQCRDILRPCLGRTSENSPGFQPWGSVNEVAASPEGTTDARRSRAEVIHYATETSSSELRRTLEPRPVSRLATISPPLRGRRSAGEGRGLSRHSVLAAADEAGFLVPTIC